jgi:hypothetical protein
MYFTPIYDLPFTIYERIASLSRLFIDRDHPTNQTFLIPGKLFRQSVNREPISFFDLKAAGLWRSQRARAKIDFDLSRPFQRSDEQERNVIDLDPDFFPQFAAQAFFRLLMSAQEASGNSPTTVGTKDMLKQQDATFIIEDHRARSDRESRLTEPHQSPANRARYVSPD